MADRRVLTLEEQLLANQIDVDSLGNGLVARMVQLLDAVRDDLLAKAAKMDAEGDPISLAIRDRELLLQADAALLDLANDHAAMIGAARVQVVRNEFETLTRSILGATGEIPANPLTKLDIQAASKAILDSRVMGLLKIRASLDGGRSAMLQRLDNLLGVAALKGSSADATAGAIREALKIGRNRANTLARTALLDAAAKARKEVYKANADLIVSYTYLATLDSRTCPICMRWDLITKVKLEDLPTTPQHGNCRCFPRPNTKFQEVIDRPAIIESEKRVIKHRDGSTSTKFRPKKAKPVSSQTVFAKFFENQPAKWKRDVLGPARWRLWQTGKLSLADLAEGPLNNQRILTLSELERIVADRIASRKRRPPIPRPAVVPPVAGPARPRTARKARPATTPKQVAAVVAPPKAAKPTIDEIAAQARAADYATARKLTAEHAAAERKRFLDAAGVVEADQRPTLGLRKAQEKAAKLEAEMKAARTELMARMAGAADARARGDFVEARRLERGTNNLALKVDDLADSIKKLDLPGKAAPFTKQDKDRARKALLDVFGDASRKGADMGAAFNGTEAPDSFSSFDWQAIRARKNDAKDFLARLLGPGAPTVNPAAFYGNAEKVAAGFGRAHAVAERDASGKLFAAGVRVRPGDLVRTHVHEMGHSFEQSSERWRQRTTAFLKSRRITDRTAKIGGLYDPSEIFFADHDLTVYPGRVANNYMAKKYSGGQSEVVSMGVEQLFLDPVTFALNDPDAFDFLVSLLRGWI